MILLCILAWLLCGYAGCRLAGISNEYMECFMMDSLIAISGGVITLIASILMVVRWEDEK